MKNDIDKDAEYFDTFDVENAQRIKHPLIKKAQERFYQKAENMPFDSDVLLWITNQNEDTKQHFNEMLRREMVFLQQVART